MATVPTGKLEQELRAAYLRWLRGLDYDDPDIAGRIAEFQRQADAIIAKQGGRIARLGVAADFPAPKLLELTPHVNTIYNKMQQAAIQASIATGLNSKEAARAMFNAGMGKSYRQLERLARTETVRAYWTNQRAEADGLGLVMVWSVESSKRTCEWCKERDGMVVMDGAHDHPNGRCTLVAMLPSRVNYKGTVAPDGSIFWDPDWDKQFETGAGQAPALLGQQAGPPVTTLGDVPNPATQDLDPVQATNPRVIKSLKDMDDFASKMINPLEVGPASKDWVEGYIQGSAYQTNAVLRGEKKYLGRAIDARTKAYVKKTTKTADDLFDQSLVPEDVKVVRTVRMDAFGGEDKLRELAGGIFQDKGYMSTSLADKVSDAIYNVADGVEMDITVPKGTRALFMSGKESYLRSERELLLDRGTRLAVQSVEYDEKRKKWKVKATVLPGPR